MTRFRACRYQHALESARTDTDRFGQPQIEITFTKSGARQFAEITRQNLKKRLAIIINGKICRTPIIMTEIPGGAAQINGGFSMRDAENVARQINETIASH